MNTIINTNGITAYWNKFQIRGSTIPIKIQIIMKLFALYLLIFCSCSFADVKAQKVHLNVKSARFQDVAFSIQKQTGYSFALSKRFVAMARPVTIKMTDAELNSVLISLFRDQPFTYAVDGKIISLVDKPKSENDLGLVPDIGVVVQQTVSGLVTDAKTGQPLIGATVTILEQDLVSKTDHEGRFSIQIKNSTAKLTVTHVGYEAVERKVTAGENLNITLSEMGAALDEVVVVGFGNQKNRNITGAISTINAKEIANRPVSRASQMLQGLAPGLNVTQSSGGSLESTPTINIRGIGTIGQGSAAAPLILVDGVEGDIHSINPNDIANISILKDASASSIYGSRAAFGVILVTTKSSEAGKNTVSYVSNWRWNNPVNMPHMVDSYRFATYFNEAATNAGATPHFTEERLQRIQDYMAGKIDYNIIPHPSIPDRWAGSYNEGNDNLDWYKVMYKNNSFSQEHNFSSSGGSDNIQYYASVNYMGQNGLLKLTNDDMQRYGATLRVSGRLSSYVKLDFSNRFLREDYERPYFLNPSFFNDLARQGWPMLPLYDPNGYLFSTSSPALNLVDGGRDTKQFDQLYQQLKLTFEPVHNWRTYAEFNYRTRNNFNHYDILKTYNHDVAGEPFVNNTNSQVFEGATKGNLFNTNIYSEYSGTFVERHQYKVMLGFQSEVYNQRNMGASRVGIISANQPVINLTSGLDINGNAVAPYLSGEKQTWSTAGIFGRLNYNYSNRYLFEFNLRYDGTSRFRADRRWNWFPSVSAGWDIVQEGFMQKIRKDINQFKIRASYGILGNQNTNNWYPTYAYLPVNPSSGTWLVNGMKPTTSSAPGLISQSLTWERVKGWNVGTDLAVLNQRLTASFDIFQRNTVDMVGPAPELPVTLGTAVPTTNNTDLITRGFEATLSWQDRTSGDFAYKAKILLSDTKTEISRYPNREGLLSTYRKGQIMGEIWGYETLGIAQSQEMMNQHLATLPNGGQNSLGTRWEAGDIMYKDLDGNGRIDAGAGTFANPGDRRIIGNSSPRYQFGIDLGANWKNFDVNAFFQGVLKRDFYSGSYYFWGMGQSIWFATAFEEHMDYFRADPDHLLGANLDAYYPRPLSNGSSKNQQAQTRYLQDASYIRLKNLQLGYSIPLNLLQRIKLQSCRIYLSGENLWTGTKTSKVFDPETIDGRNDGAVVYPLFKVYSMGLNINF